MTLKSPATVYAYVLSKDAVHGLDFKLSSPTSVDVCAGCWGGESAKLGYFPEDTELVTSLYDNQTTQWYPSTSTHAQISQIDSTRWVIGWDDAGGDGDFNDLVTAISTRPLSASDLYGLANPLTKYRGCSRGDPVDNATGNFSETVMDLTFSVAGAGQFPAAVGRTYNSLNAATDGPFGFGWTSNNAWKATEDTLSGGVTITAGNGATSSFYPDGNGGYANDAQVVASLAKVTGGGWTLTWQPHLTVTFDASGRPVKESSISGQATTLTYGTNGLSSVTDPTGRSITYTYNTSGRVGSVAGPSGRQASYTYDTAGNLATVTDPAGNTTSMTYDSGHRLLTLTDPRSKVTTNTYDTQGRVQTQQDPNNKTTTWAYTSGADGDTTTTVTDPKGAVSVFKFHYNVLQSKTVASGTALARTTQYEYDPTLQPTKVTDPRGNSTVYTYDDSGDLLTRTDALGKTTNFTYNAGGDRTSALEPGATTPTTWTYNGDGLATSQRDPLGRVTTMTYTVLGEIDVITSPRGKPTNFDYDAAGNQTRVTSPGPQLTVAAYNASGWPLAVTDPRGNKTGAVSENYTTHVTYDALGRVLTETDPADTVTTNTYDGNGNLTHQTVTSAAPDNTVLRDETYTYSATDQLATDTNVDRPKLTNTYDDADHLASSTDGTGAKTTYSFDAAGQVSSMTTARGNATGATAADYTWTYKYDLNGNRTDVLDPMQRDTVTGYDEVNRPTSLTTPLGNTTLTGYDAMGRITSRIDPRGTVAGAIAADYATTYSYDLAGQLKTQALPGEAATTYGYDADGDLNSIISPSGTSKTTFTYGAAGNVTSRVDPLGNVPGGTPANYTTSFAYDPVGNLLSETNQLGKSTTYSYDRLNNQMSKTDPLNHVTTWGYDGLNRLATVTLPSVGTGTGSAPTTYQYDKYGDLTQRTDALGHITTYGYDGEHRLTQVIDALNRKRTYNYDPEGNLASWIGARGYASGDLPAWTVNQSFDARGLLTARTTSGAASSSTYGYDDDGRMTSMSDQTGTSTLGYNPAGALSALTQPQGNYAYTYTKAGRVASRSLPVGGDVTYGYNADGLADKITADGNANTLGYDANQALTTLTYPSANLTETRGYARDGRVSSVTNAQGATIVSKHAYTRDAAGNPTLVQRTRGTNTSSESYVYDARDRLTQWCPAASCTNPASYIAYQYDPVGGRTKESRVGVSSPGTRTYTLDAAEQFTSKATTIGGTTTTTNYTWDADGNLTTGSRVWDPLGRLTSQSLGGATYTYDGLGNRRTITDPAGIKNLSWDINNPMPMLGVVKDGSGATYAQRYDPDGGIIESYQPTGAIRSFYGHDDLGSVTDIIQGNTPAYNFSYEPFGSTITTNKLQAGAVDTNFGWTGQYHQPNQDQYLLRARDYNPTSGTFVAPDPANPPLDQGATSPYGYAGNQPSVLTDPTGQCLTLCTALIGAGIGAVFSGGTYALTHQGDDFSWKGLAVATGTGAITGAVAGATFGVGAGLGAGAAGALGAGALGQGAAGAVTGGFAAGVVGDATDSMLSGDGIPSACELGTAGLTSVATGAIGFGAGALAGRAISAAAASRGSSIAAKSGPLIKAGSEGGESAGRAFSQRVRQEALDENPSTCVYCRMETDRPQVDHAIPRSRGGNASLDNAQTTCAWCNPSKGARDFPVNPPPGFEGMWPPSWWGLP